MTDDAITTLKQKYPGAETFSFGDNPGLSASLLALVLSGKKTATCGALRDFGPGGEAMPEVGRHDIVLGPDGIPAAVIRTLSLETMPYNQVGADFAAAEGEGDGSLENWRRDHEVYFARNGGFDPEMMLVCERFVLVEAL